MSDDHDHDEIHFELWVWLFPNADERTGFWPWLLVFAVWVAFGYWLYLS